MSTLVAVLFSLFFCSNLFFRAIFYSTSCCSLRTWLLRIYNGIWLKESDCFRTAIAIKSFPYSVIFGFSSLFCTLSLLVDLLQLSLCIWLCWSNAFSLFSLSVRVLFWMLIKIIVLQCLKHGMKENVWNTHAKCFHVSSDFVVIVSFNTIDRID